MELELKPRPAVGTAGDAPASVARAADATRICSVLVALSPDSERLDALELGLGLARDCRASLTLGTVVCAPPPLIWHPGPFTVSQPPEVMLAEAVREAELRLLMAAQAVPHDVPVTTRVAVGKPFVRLLEMARELGSGALVLGRRRRSGVLARQRLCTRLSRAVPSAVIVTPE